MTGSGDWQFVLFALAIGLSEVKSGLVATVPVLAGAVLQLLTPWGVRIVGSIRRWVYLCAAAQALTLVGLAVAAITGGISGWLLYVVVAMYWATGYMTGPPWITWVSSLVPDQIRARFWVPRLYCVGSIRNWARFRPKNSSGSLKIKLLFGKNHHHVKLKGLKKML